MRRILLTSLLIFLACGAAGAQELKDIEEAYLKIVRKVRPCVVAVTVSKTASRREGGRVITNVSTTQFSGIVVSDKGHIATIGKGVKGASRIIVETVKGDSHEAELVGVDDRHNVGIIKVKNLQNWTAVPAEFGDSGKLEVGSLTVIIGCPSGLKHSVVYGNVSGLGRTLVTPKTFYTNMIQLSNPVSHSDPGGLIANSEGKLVGMVSPAFMKTPSFRRVEELIEALNKKIADLSSQLARVKKPREKDERKPRTPRDEVKRGMIRQPLSPDLYDPALSQGINFAIPGNAVKQVCDRIIHKKKVAWLGVRVRALYPPEKQHFKLETGLFVLQVVPGSPAAKGGMKSRDIIVRVGENAIGETEKLRIAIQDIGVDGELKLTIFRKKKEIEAKVKLGELK